MMNIFFKNYKPFIAIPIILLIVSLGILVNNYAQNGEWFARSIELRGGTLITIALENPVDIASVQSELSPEFSTLVIRELRGFSGYKLLIEADENIDSDSLIKKIEEGYPVTGFSVETMGPALGEAFWYQTQLAIILAFIMMGVIVFAIFRTLVPSAAVILAAMSDILVTLALMQVFGIELSLAGMAALLMLIGYSVDTDIMLTSKLLRTSGDIVDKLKNAIKTGLTMTLTTIGVLVVLIIFNISAVLTEIAVVLFIGLVIDIINTWLQNSVLLRWHCERKGIQ
ncbi:MAG: protein translocase subunit SecF [Nanoarchaeota archaeon]|nr:protein translocase subunit SecF [Nanoarchaeota archaeon]